MQVLVVVAGAISLPLTVVEVDAGLSLLPRDVVFAIVVAARVAMQARGPGIYIAGWWLLHMKVRINCLGHGAP